MQEPSSNETESQDSGRQRDWAAIREWLNVFATIGMLLIGVVSIWTTARISGVEDYFRSEVTRRNSDLNSLSERSAALERVAKIRAEQLLELQTSIDTLIAASLDAQRRLSDTQSELDKVRYEVLSAELTLDKTLRDQVSAQALFDEQATQFDLFKRKKTYTSTIIRMILRDFYENEDDSLIGSKIEDVLLTFPLSEEDMQLSEYYESMRANFPKVCPHFRSLKPDLPKVSPKPEPPTITYRSDASSAHIAALTKEAQDKWSREWEEWNVSINSNNKAHINWLEKIHETLRVCVCRSLASEKFAPSMVCPS